MVAFAANRKELTDIGFVVFDLPPDTGIQIIQTAGHSPDSVVNGLHRDMVELTTTRLTRLAAAMFNGEKSELLPKPLKVLINDGISAGRLDRTKMSQKLLAQL